MKKITINNGLRILLEETQVSNIASFAVFVGAGTRYEELENNGISHFVEHIVFKGTESRTSAQLSEIMEDIGAMYNAFTAKELTCFHATSLSRYITTAMDVVFDMITHPRLDPRDIEVEKGVVIEEITMCEDDPYDTLVDGTFDLIWRDSLLGKNILGSKKTISQINAEKIREYMKKFYVPERIVISISGNVDQDAVLDKIIEYFGGMENTGNPVSCEKAVYHPSVFTAERDFEQLNLFVGFDGAFHGEPHEYSMKVLSNILGGSSSSRLFRRIREERGLVYSIGTTSANYAKEGFFAVSMGVSKKNEKEALEETYKVLSEVRDNGITQQEFERVKNSMSAAISMSSEAITTRANLYGRNELIHNEIVTFAELANIYDNITLDQVNAAAKQYIDFSKATFAVVGKNLCKPRKYAKFLKKGIL